MMAHLLNKAPGAILKTGKELTDEGRAELYEKLETVRSNYDYTPEESCAWADDEPDKSIEAPPNIIQTEGVGYLEVFSKDAGKSKDVIPSPPPRPPLRDIYESEDIAAWKKRKSKETQKMKQTTRQSRAENIEARKAEMNRGLFSWLFRGGKRTASTGPK